jgi:transposase-like protein
MPKIRHAPDVKARAVIRNLQDNVEVSTICGELSIHPTVFYQWRKQFLDSAAMVFKKSDTAETRKTQRQIADFERRIQKKDMVIAELLEEYTALKKRMGRVRWLLGGIRPAGQGCRVH